MSFLSQPETLAVGPRVTFIDGGAEFEVYRCIGRECLRDAWPAPHCRVVAEGYS